MTLFLRFFQQGFATSLLMSAAITATPIAFAAALPDNDTRTGATLDAQEQLRQQARERALQQQNAPDNDVRLARPDAVTPDYPVDEKPCFMIHSLRLQGDLAPRFQWALDAAEGAKGRCLGG